MWLALVRLTVLVPELNVPLLVQLPASEIVPAPAVSVSEIVMPFPSVRLLPFKFRIPDVIVSVCAASVRVLLRLRVVPPVLLTVTEPVVKVPEVAVYVCALPPVKVSATVPPAPPARVMLPPIARVPELIFAAVVELLIRSAPFIFIVPDNMADTLANMLKVTLLKIIFPGVRLKLADSGKAKVPPLALNVGVPVTVRLPLDIDTVPEVLVNVPPFNTNDPLSVMDPEPPENVPPSCSNEFSTVILLAPWLIAKE